MERGRTGLTGLGESIFTSFELSTVFDQDPHDFPDRCTVIPMRPGRAEFYGRICLPDA
jgi:hypothetical protein